MKIYILLFLFAVSLLCFTGCGKKATADLLETQAQTVAAVKETQAAISFNYAPGSMGIYVKAASNIEAEPEVLDSFSMTLSDKKTELTRHRVSDCQFDIVKSGRQVGGFLLVDISRDVLKKASESRTNFETAAGAIASQVMGEVYPSKTYISGGGHVDFAGYNISPFLLFMIQAEDGCQYIHNVYIGEKYIYDFWYDTSYLTDSGETVLSTLSAEDITPERNRAESWSVHDFSD